MDFIVTENGIHQVTSVGMRRLAELEEAGRIAQAIRETRGRIANIRACEALIPGTP